MNTASGCSWVAVPPMLTVTVEGCGVGSDGRFCDTDVFQGMRFSFVCVHF